MNPLAILALLSDLYEQAKAQGQQLDAANARIAELETALADARTQ